MKYFRTTITLLTWMCGSLVVGFVVDFINGNYNNAVCNIMDRHCHLATA